MKRRYHTLVVFILLFMVFFLYRIAFRDDFRFMNLVQIILNAMFDVLVVFLLGWVTQMLTERVGHPYNKTWQTFIRYLLMVGAYWLSVKLLKLLHYVAYTITVGVSKEFLAVFELESYQIFDTYIVVAFGIAILLAYRFYERWNRERTWKEEAEKERALAELNFLKAQINPHFVFNTLNNIHFLIDAHNKDARNAMHHFSELLRYQLYETSHEKVQISKEISYLEHYITLQKIRKEEGFTVTLDTAIPFDFRIAPMLLIVPVENAFKFTGNQRGDYIRISLQVVLGNQFIFKVVNSKGKDPGPKDRTSSGVGLANLKKRLELIYGQHAQLEIHDFNQHYEVFITINLRQHESD